MKAPLVYLAIISVSAAGHAAEVSSSSLPRSIPEKQGISSEAILDFVQSADKEINAIHSFMLVRHGCVVAEGWWSPYGPEIPHVMFSLSKSFTATAIGLAAAEGKLSLDDPVLKFFPDETPANPGENLKAMRVRDLLRMNTGQHSEEVAKISLQNDEHPLREFLALEVAHKPGTHFYYNTPATYVESAIVQKTTGLTVLDYLRPRLFEPLGIEHPTWVASKEGISLGGTGLSIRTEDIARFGQLYLQKGKWRGKQLLPASWVEAASSRQTSNGSNPTSDWEQGYGYNFWRCRHDLYRGDGAFGQFCIVMPEQDAVVAITSGTGNMQGVMNLVWDKLLPAMQEKPLRANTAAHEKLQHALAGLMLPPIAGETTSPLASRVSGRKYLFPENDLKLKTLSLDLTHPEAAIQIEDETGSHHIVCGPGKWYPGQTSFAAGASSRLIQPGEQPVAASGAWTANDTYTVKLAYYQTQLAITLSFRFAGEELMTDVQYSVQFTPEKPPHLVGKFQSQ